MAKVRRNIEGFIALPVQLPTTSALPQPAIHYIYLKPHDPPVPDANSPRSLFAANIPITTTGDHLKFLFGEKLLSGRVERVDFGDSPSIGSKTKLESHNGRKRKRVTAEEAQLELEGQKLPDVVERVIHDGGAHAVVVFVDRASMEASLKAAKKATKMATSIIWGKGIKSRVSSLGLQRYKQYNHDRYPPRRVLLQSVDSYMSAYSKIEEAKARLDAKKRQEPDEEGFVAVIRGIRSSAVEEQNDTGEKQKEKSQGLEDFYRFQMRERRKDEQGDFLKRFEEDKRRVAEMKQRRGRLRVSHVDSILM